MQPNYKTPQESETTMTEIIFPNDTNPMGIVQGGRIVQLMDIACAVSAQVHSGRIAVTASINNINFNDKAILGDVLTIKARITRVFTSSMEIYVEVWAKRLPLMQPFLTNSAYFTFVALDDDQKPAKIIPVKPVTAMDKIRFREALSRRKKSQNSKLASVAALKII